MKWLLILLLFTTNVLWAGPNSSFGLSPTLRSGLVAHWTMNDAPGYSYAGPFDMVAWYKMDEGSGTLTTADSSGNGNTGSLINSPAWTNGVIGSALKFNGSTTGIGTSLNLSNYSQITYCAWIKLPSLPSSYKFFVTTDGAGGFGGFTLGIADDNRIYASGNNGYAIALNAAVANTWYFLCGSATNTQLGKILLYINGVIDTAGSSALITSVGNSTTLNIGQKLGPFTPIYINATIDDVRIYNRALSASEIANIYNTEVGNYTTDSSGNGNTGYLTNSPAWTNGVVGSALKFNGIQSVVNGTYIGIANSPSLQTIQSNMSFSVWFNINATTNGGVFVCKSVGSQTPPYETFLASLDSLQPTVIIGDGTNRFIYTANVFFNTNKWYNFSYTYNGSQLNLYSNAVNIASTNFSIKIGTNQWPVTIGSCVYFSDVYNGVFNGIMDDIRIYNRALSSDEILKL